MFIYTSNTDDEGAIKIAEKLNISITTVKPEDELYLSYEDGCLSLCRASLSMMGDFTGMITRVNPGRLGSELLVKSAKLKNYEGLPVAIDATAGMAEDSMLLAAAGFYVHLYERDSIIAALLENALERAREIPELSDIVSRMELHNEDSIEAMNNLSFTPDVIYLDPMFPARNKSGLIKKKFQLLQQLEAPCADENELVAAALAARPHKIVIKRPLKGPFLAGKKPSYSHPGKAIRYDCLLLS